MEKKYFLMGNAHLDPVWQWRVPEGLSLVKSTFKAALDRMEEFPDYVFTSACAGYYQWIRYSEPEMFEEIKKKVKEGRWQYTGAMWVQPDCNIPSGEAFARHFLYSQKFYAENFGKKAETAYNVDSFGHNGMLPQLMAKSGIKNYVYMRPHRGPEKPNLPFENLHWWESPDGSRVLAFRILDGYGDSLKDERIERYESQPHSQMLAYGVGNHGGGPSIETLQMAEKLREGDGKEKYIYSGVDKYFDYVRNNEPDDFPVVKEDLQHHASGCYSANSKVKMLNRQAENGLVYAEKIDVMANLLTGSQTQTDRIERAWQRVMFNQFHDILAGCSIKPAYDDAYSAFGCAKEVALEVGTFAAERISWRVNTTKFFENGVPEQRGRLWVREGEGSPMVVFNPHSFPVKEYVCFGTQWVSGVVDSNDNDVPFQLIRAPYTDGDHVNMCMFEVDMPAFGYATYFIYKEDQNHEAKTIDNQFIITENSIENSIVRIEFDADGAISSYFNKPENKEYCKAPMKAVVCEDKESDTWGHMVFDYNKDIGSFGNAEFKVLETGNIRATLKVTSYYNESKLEQYFTLYKDSPKVAVKCRINFREKYKILKLTFPMNVENPEAVYSMPYGFIKKTPDGLEEPAQKWISVQGDNGGVALINNGRYSFCVKDNEMRMIAARTCAFLDHFGQRFRDDEISFIDMDELELEYALIPHAKNGFTDVVKAAEVLNMPLQLYQETHHKGSLPPVYEGLTVDCDNVIVTSLKLAEDGTGYIARAVECASKPVMAEFNFRLLDRKFAFDFKPQEIKTIFIPKEGGSVKGVPITEK